MKTNCVVIDNYDSFTYNLVHLIKELGANVTVVRNNQFNLEDLNAYDRILLSPGPGIPSEAGLLGHQAIGEVFGAKLRNLSDVFHGVTTEITQIIDTPLFAGVPKQFPVGRYHSWVIERTNFPNCLEIIAESKEGLIMALRHKTHNIYGIQFHPESVLTPDGRTIIANWLHI